jgi:hypothetical protein
LDVLKYELLFRRYQALSSIHPKQIVDQ